MIGVITSESQRAVVREFFELFKTPWEFYRRDRHYDVVLCDGSDIVEGSAAKLVVVYGGRELPFDTGQGRQGHLYTRGTRMLVAASMRLPIYKESVTFSPSESGVLMDEISQRPAAYTKVGESGQVVARIGYDLFAETAFLLTEGQPLENAGIPALDLHISLLRSLILHHGIQVAEIPPVPRGYRFIACLTHDVDHPSIRLHRFDHTMLGFLYRAIVGSAWSLVRGRMTARFLFRNWAAVLKLPLVFLGLSRDSWNEFEVYKALEGESVRSSFFVIPFKSNRGAGNGNPPPKRRASPYAAADLADKIRQLMAAGHEIGLHGIDAWHDEPNGRRELHEINRVSESEITGARMHWLYFDQNSPGLLDRLGFDYDSTVGYNETIGYRAGTSQVYRPIDARRLLELPLHVMDTALFFPGCLNLSFPEARRAVGEIIDHAARFGGVVTINWHDRSLAPERLWGGFYVDLLDELRARGAWLANARDTIRWFRKRRAAEFDDCDRINEDGARCIELDQGLPEIEPRVHTEQTRSSELEPARAWR